MPKIKFECANCGKEKTRFYGNDVVPKIMCCSLECANIKKKEYKFSEKRKKKYYEMFVGEKNPNFGNSWSDEQKKVASEKRIEMFENDPDYRYACGKTNRGKKLKKETIEKMHNPERVYSSVNHTEETKRIIGEKSKEKWTEEYKKEHRKRLEDLGFWIKKEDKSEFDLYYKESNWLESMLNFLDESETENLKKFGIFNSDNTKGYVRDHIVSRKEGFLFNIPPQIIRHPCNMQFISHFDNISKGFKDRGLTDLEISDKIKNLIQKIYKFDKDWIEQELCLNLIKENENLYYERYSFRA